MFSFRSATVSVRTSIQSLAGTFFQTREFSKYISKSRKNRLPMTTKRAGKGYYKGNGSRKEGFLTSKGRFILQRELCTELVMPTEELLATFKPYVTKEAHKRKI